MKRLLIASLAALLSLPAAAHDSAINDAGAEISGRLINLEAADALTAAELTTIKAALAKAQADIAALAAAPTPAPTPTPTQPLRLHRRP